MATLYLRNVPDDVMTRLRQLAEREGTSVNQIAVHELDEASARAANPALLAALPDLDISASEIVEALDQERVDR